MCIQLHVTKPKDGEDKTRPSHQLSIAIPASVTAFLCIFVLVLSCQHIIHCNIEYPRRKQTLPPLSRTAITCLDNNTKPAIKKKNSDLPPAHALQAQHPLSCTQPQYRIAYHVFHKSKHTSRYDTHGSSSRDLRQLGPHRRTVFRPRRRRNPRSRR